MSGSTPIETGDSIFPKSNAAAQKPAAIATLVNEHAYVDFERFLKSLSHWQEYPLYIFTTKSLEAKIRNQTYTAPIHIRTDLEPYAHLTRGMMEHSPSRNGHPNLFYDFTLEKITLMEWAISSLTEEDRPRGVLFCDADIFWFSKPPTIPTGKTLAVSPHMIRRADEIRYGQYNAGFLWTNSPTNLQAWREATRISHFFEQVSIETVVNSLTPDKIYFFGSEVNYGWWRMYQSADTPIDRQSKWSIRRTETNDHSPLFVDGQPLCCVHTHFTTTDRTTQQFNEFLLEKMKILKQNKHIRALQKIRA